MHLTYENTSINAIEIGWAIVPEYCEGDPNAPFVTHDTEKGIFKFHNGWSLWDHHVYPGSPKLIKRFPDEYEAINYLDTLDPDDVASGQYTIDGPEEE